MKWIVLCLIAATAATADVMLVAQAQPKPAPKQVSKVTPAVPKGGELLVVTSEADAVFDFDGVFPLNTTRQATVVGEDGKPRRELCIAVPKCKESKVYVVRCLTTMDKKISIERLEIKVLGTDQPPEPPMPPNPKDPLSVLRAELLQGLAKIDERLKALEARPPPPPPLPPVPPKPPEPKPDVSPIPVAGFRVMIIEDKEKLSLLPAAQLSIRTSKVFRDYLDANCAGEPDGKTKAYRIWDHKTVATGDLKLWQDALARPRTSMPWIIISNFPSGGYEGPLPANVEETIKLMNKIKSGG